MPLNFSRGIYVLLLGSCLFHFASAQGLAKLVKHYADQEKACAEFDKCMSKLANSTNGVPSAVKVVELGPNVADIPVHQMICARRSNCRHQQRAFCEPHMGENGTVEMKFFCQLSWMSGSDETDARDPTTSLSIEENQEVACSNYEKCVGRPNEEFPALNHVPHDKALGHVPTIAKQVICSVRNNCLKEMKSLCDEERLADKGHRVAKIVSVFCGFVTYTEFEEKNPTGSRSLGGAASLSQQVLSDVCKSPKDGVCSLV